MATYYTNAFATFYDRYYTGWVRDLAPKLVDYLTHNQSAEHSLLDLCCGTGITVAAFCDARWSVIGLDLSHGMLRIAKEKLAPMIKTGQVQFIESDAIDFVLPKQVGACICLDGALNHLESCAQLERSFVAVSAALLEGGQFLFDLYEPAHFRHWHHITLIDEPDVLMIKHGVWDDKTMRGILRVSGALGKGSECERIEQTLHSLAFTSDEVTHALAVAGLICVDCELENTSIGMRSEASQSKSPVRTIYRALKPPQASN